MIRARHQSLLCSAVLTTLVFGSLTAPARSAQVLLPVRAQNSTIALGYNQSIILGADGTPYAAGLATYGSLGVATADQDLALTPMQGLPASVRGTAVAAGFESSYVLGSDGFAYATGRNAGGSLGVGDAGPDRFSLTRVQGLPIGVRAVAVAAGFQFVLVLGSDGVPYAAGVKADAITGSVRSSLAPMTGLPAGRRAVAVAAGRNHSLVLDNTGRVHGSGKNAVNGQLTGSTDQTVLTQLTGMPQGVRVTAVAAGNDHSVLLGSDRFVYAVGDNSSGQLGTGDLAGPRRTPVRMRDSAGAVGVAAGSLHSLALMSNGTVLGTGASLSGQLTTGGTAGVLEPLKAGESDDPIHEVVEITAGQVGTLIRDRDGVVFGTGINDYRQHDGATYFQLNALKRVANQRISQAASPTIGGAPGVGKKLQATAGAWSPTPTGLTYSWYDGATLIGSGSTYTPTISQAGRRIRVRVGSTRAGFVSANGFSSYASIPIHSLKRPTLTGTWKVGRRVRVKTGSWTPQPAKFSIRWLRNGRSIAGASSARYKLTKRDKGARISVRVTAHRAGSADGAASSAAKRVR